MIIELSERIKNDPLAMTIISIIKAMKADYGSQYSRDFPTEESVILFKRRLYKKLNGLSMTAIVDGYETAAAESPKFCPNIIRIVACALAAEKEEKRIEKNKAEAERVGALPPPTITCNPMKMLREAIAKISDEEKGITKAEKWQRHLKRLKAHEELINTHKAKIRYDVNDHKCATPNCWNAGTLSHSVSGGSNYYCPTHFMSA